MDFSAYAGLGADRAGTQLRLAAITAGIIAVTLGCSVFAQRNAEKPLGTHYSAAFLTGGDLVVFPFDGKKITADLPSPFTGYSFSADGKSIYGFAGSTGTPPIAAVSVRPPGLTAIKASQGLRDIESVAADADGGIVAVSAVRQRDGAQECGVFVLDVVRETAEHVVDNAGGECFDFVSFYGRD